MHNRAPACEPDQCNWRFGVELGRSAHARASFLTVAEPTCPLCRPLCHMQRAKTASPPLPIAFAARVPRVAQMLTPEAGLSLPNGAQRGHRSARPTCVVCSPLLARPNALTPLCTARKPATPSLLPPPPLAGVQPALSPGGYAGRPGTGAGAASLATRVPVAASRRSLHLVSHSMQGWRRVPHSIRRGGM